MVLPRQVSVFADARSNLLARTEAALCNLPPVDDAVGYLHRVLDNKPGAVRFDDARITNLPARLGIKAGLIKDQPDLPDARESAEEPQGGDAREVAGESVPFGKVPHLDPGRRPDRIGSADSHRAAGGPAQAEQDLHQGRLAGAVGPEQAEHLAPAHLEVDAVQCAQPTSPGAIDLDQTVDRDDGVHTPVYGGGATGVPEHPREGALYSRGRSLYSPGVPSGGASEAKMATSAWQRPWCGSLRIGDVDREVELVGWVRRRRDLGGLVFADLRDRSGIVQLVFESEVLAAGEGLSQQDVLLVRGTVRPRAEGQANEPGLGKRPARPMQGSGCGVFYETNVGTD